MIYATVQFWFLLFDVKVFARTGASEELTDTLSH